MKNVKIFGHAQGPRTRTWDVHSSIGKRQSVSYRLQSCKRFVTGTLGKLHTEAGETLRAPTPPLLGLPSGVMKGEQSSSNRANCTRLPKRESSESGRGP